MAGAGTGKTRTLIERVVQRLFDPRSTISLDEILMVTFTEAAAAEIRQRLRARLEEEVIRCPGDSRLAGQLALLDSAHICTLHSFCLELTRQHFYELGLDPHLSVLDENQTQRLGAETLDKLLREHYGSSSPESVAVLALIRDYANGWDQPIRESILRLHDYTQTRPDPAGWFKREIAQFSRPEPEQWRQWLAEGCVAWRERWLPVLAAEAGENKNARHCADILQRSSAFERRDLASVDALQADKSLFLQWSGVLTEILATDQSWPAKKKLLYRKPLEKFYDEAAFLASLLSGGGGSDPLEEDWSWVRFAMITLLQLAHQFSEQFSMAKRESAVLDFHDLEQCALRLLWDANFHEPTALARQWRDKLKLVCVDEYQDINAAQDAILRALSHDGARANRFLVGDIKQSIYRFRQAAPEIFQAYAARCRSGEETGEMIALSDNFRSHEAVLNFVNPFFAALMRREIGGVEFDEAAQLRFGDREGRVALSLAGEPTREPANGNDGLARPRVEINLALKERSDENSEDEELVEISDSEREARLVGERLLELHSSDYAIWDAESRQCRPLTWSDIVILLRSPRHKVESFAKEFARLGIPLQARRSGFFDSIEVLDLLNLLQLLDNPLQDVPTIAVLRSPLVGLSLDELAAIRLAARKVHFWTALLRWHEVQSSKTDDGPRTWAKIDAFLQRFGRWRAAARHSSITRRLEMILDETSYLDWLLTQPRGAQRQANVQQLLALARRFDEFQQQSLYRFLKMIEAHQDTAADREPAPLEAADAVRLMSIHQSKGLEFPVVVVADLGKRFNFTDNAGGIILDDRFGVCPQVKPPHTSQRYPSIAYWLAQRRQRENALGEELRIFYVALTRAQDSLILFGTCGATALERWERKASPAPTTHQCLRANNFLDWLGPWLGQQVEQFSSPEGDAGETDLWRWRIHRSRPGRPGEARNGSSEAFRRVLSRAPEQTEARMDQRPPDFETADLRLRALVQRLAWNYAHPGAVLEPAKTSVTAIRRKLTDEADQEARRAYYTSGTVFAPVALTLGESSPVDIGNAHHRFLQFAKLEALQTAQGVENEAQRLLATGMLSAAEAKALNFVAITRFWMSGLGERLRGHAAFVRRELPFTIRVGFDALAEHPLAVTVPAGEFLVVQGVIDLAAVLPHEIWLVDFKTDAVTEAELPDKTARYAPQLQVYALALGRIYQRPVRECWLHFLTPGKSIAVSPV